MKENGMALMEVMVAMLILAISATAMLKTNSQQIKYLSQLEQKQTGLWIAESKMADIILHPSQATALWQQDLKEMGNTGWHLRWRQVQTTDRKIVAVEVEVRKDKVEQPVAVLRTFVSHRNAQV